MQESKGVSVAELLERNLHGIFGERDSRARRAALEACWRPDGVFVDPDGRYVGLDAIEECVEALQARFQGFVFASLGEAQVMQGVGRMAWSFGPPDRPAAVTGLDVAVTHDGKIRELYAFIEK